MADKPVTEKAFDDDVLSKSLKANFFPEQLL